MTPTPSVISESPAHAQALGEITANWAVCEKLLTLTLSFVLQIDQSKAQLLWGNFVNFRAKREFIERLCNIYIADCEAKTDLLEALKSANALSSERNKYIHATWLAGEDKNTLIASSGALPNRTDKRIRPGENVSADDLERVALRISELNSNFLELLDRLPLEAVVYQRPSQ